jgi:DNA replication protein DnaC
MPIIFEHYNQPEIMLDLITIQTEFKKQLELILPKNIDLDDVKSEITSGDPDCPICQGSGYDTRRFRSDIECRCVKGYHPKWLEYHKAIQLIDQQLNNLNSTHSHIGFAKVNEILTRTGNVELYHRGLDFARTALKSGSWCLTNGPTGLGKTVLAYAIAEYAFIHFGWNIEFFTVNQILWNIERLPDSIPYDSYPDSFRCKTDLIEYWVRIPLLGIDDLGTEIKDKSVPIIAEIICLRKEQSNPTLLTTNLTMEQLEQKYQPRTMRRIFENTDKE